MLNYNKTKRQYNIIYNTTIIIFKFIIMIKIVNSYNISMTINKNGYQQILDIHFIKPSEVYINDIVTNINDNNIYYLSEDNNVINITWYQKIDSCEKMFFNLTNISSIDFIDFDTSSV